MIAAILADGPVPLDDMIDRLGESGVVLPLVAELDPDPDDETLLDIIEEMLHEAPGIWVADDDTVHRTSVLLDGVVLTHRVTADEVRDGALRAVPDLTAVMFGLDGRAELVGGGTVSLEIDWDRDDVMQGVSIVGSDGWLDGVEPDSLVGLRREGDRIELLRSPDVDDDVAPTTDALNETYDALFEPGVGVDIEELVLETIAADGEPFRVPRLPLSEQLDDMGLRCLGGLVGPADEEFSHLGAERGDRVSADEERLDRVARRYQLDSCCRAALEVVIAGFGQHVAAAASGDVEAPEYLALADHLHHGAVIVAFDDFVTTAPEPDDEPDDETGESGAPHLVDRVESFAAELVTAGDRTAGPGHHLAALAALRAGHAREAVEALERSVRIDGYATPAAPQLATLLGDAGDVSRSLSTWRRVEDVPDQSRHVEVLAGLLDRYQGARRNDPCPCGSGRKFKQCCSLAPKLDQTQRRGLALHQVALDATQRLSDEHFGLAITAASVDDRDDHHDHDHDHDHHDHDHDEQHDFVGKLRHWAAHPFMIDVLVHEAGGLDEYLAERGELIPGDERVWLELLRDTPRAVWELVPTGDGRANLRSVLTDTAVDDVELRPVDPAPDRHAWVMGRFLLDGTAGRPGFVGATIEVSADIVANTVVLTDGRPSADELMAWIAGGSVTPVIPGPDGAPRPMGTVHFSPPDAGWSGGRAVLDERFTPDGDDRWRLIVHLGDHPEPELTLVSLERVDDELVATVFTGEQMARLRDELTAEGFGWLRAELNPDVYGDDPSARETEPDHEDHEDHEDDEDPT